VSYQPGNARLQGDRLPVSVVRMSQEKQSRLRRSGIVVRVRGRNHGANGRRSGELCLRMSRFDIAIVFGSSSEMYAWVLS